MKTRILTSLCVALVASCVSARAEDTPAQAVARAALEQKLQQLDHTVAEPSNTNSATGSATSAESATNTASVPDTTDGPTVQTAPAAVPANKASVAAPEAAPGPTVPAENTSAQAVALAALKQRMDELDHAPIEAPPETNSLAAIPISPTAAPVHEASAAATPVTETPAAEPPMARTPAITSAAVTPSSAAPAVAIPVPKVTATPVTTAPSAAVVPPAVSGPVALPTTTPAPAAPEVPALPWSSPGKVRPTNELATINGKIYKNVELQRVTDDGIFISYTPAHGGWAMTKVYFRDLPPDIRQQYEKQ